MHDYCYLSLLMTWWLLFIISFVSFVIRNDVEPGSQCKPFSNNLVVFCIVCDPYAAPFTYAWTTSNWVVCTRTCGSGTQSRLVYCQRSDGQTTDDSYCIAIQKPITLQSCNTFPCSSNPDDVNDSLIISVEVVGSVVGGCIILYGGFRAYLWWQKRNAKPPSQAYVALQEHIIQS